MTLSTRLLGFLVLVGFCWTLSVDDAFWDFKVGLDGWGNSSYADSDCEVFHSHGEMVAAARGPSPRIDSPLMLLNVTDHHFIVLRMQYQGSAVRARFDIRTSTTRAIPPDSFQYGNADWTGNSSFYADGHDDFKIVSLEFPISSEPTFQTFYVPFGPSDIASRGDSPVQLLTMTQLRLYPALGDRVGMGEVVRVDWIRISKAPCIFRVEGCCSRPPLEDPPRHTAFIRPALPLNQHFNSTATAALGRAFGSEDRASNKYSSTYNCRREGGERITITGINFGTSGAQVLINGKECSNVVYSTPESVITCTTPPGTGELDDVAVVNGQLPGLMGLKPFVSYAIPPPPPAAPTFSNIAAHSVRVHWEAPPLWEALTVTGYIIERRAVGSVEWAAPVVTTNVTSVTVLALAEDTEYQFRVAGVSDDQVSLPQWFHGDLHDRRPMLLESLVGDWCPPSEPVRTLAADIQFPSFSVNLTLDSGAADPRSSETPLGIDGGEGSYGIILVGDANLEHCDVSSTCCDNYDPETKTCPPFPDGSPSLACTAVPAARLKPDFDEYVSNIPLRSNLQENGIFFGPPEALWHSPKSSCGPSIRLTPSNAQQTGAMWYNRKMDVREGFSTDFTFKIHSPSLMCLQMEDVFTHCRARGGDGFAFVIQNHDALALGNLGQGAGFSGVPNSLAIMFDTYHNPEDFDLYENHVGVHTRGWREPNSASHAHSLGDAIGVPDLSSGRSYKARIVYDPVRGGWTAADAYQRFNERVLGMSEFQASPHVVHFMENRDYRYGGQSDWMTGMGTLSIFIDDMNKPLLIVPVNLDATLRLEHGRAWVGFTAGTGEKGWQVHDIQNWIFHSLHLVVARDPPPLVNGEGAHADRTSPE